MSVRNKFQVFPFSGDRQGGVSLVSTLVGLAIGGIAMMGAYRIYENFVEQTWYQETKADALESRDTVGRLVKRDFPNEIPNYTATDAVTNAAVWNCPTGGPCVLTNGTTLRLTITCQSISGTPLNGFNFTQAANYPPPGTRCASCAAGTRPVLTLRITKGGNTQTLEFPKQTPVQTKGLVGMGLCFATTNSGTVAAPNFDTWTITLAPMVLTRYPGAGRRRDLATPVTAYTDDIHISQISQVGSIRMSN
jgi:hypothetical protein